MEFNLQLDEAKSKHATELERAAKQIIDFESEAKLVKTKPKEADHRILRLESGRDL